MEEDEKRNIERCICDIEDKLIAIKNEIKLNKPHKYYILEKIEPILNDAKCIKSICDNEEEIKQLKQKILGRLRGD